MKQSYQIAIGAVLIAALAFFAGSKLSGGGAMPNLENMSPEQRQQALQQFRGGNGMGAPGAGGSGGATSGRRMQGANMTIGEIIQKDDKSVTIKTQDGGSKIIFFSETTLIGKTVNGTKADLEAGKQAAISGTANPDGTISATSIDIRPAVSVTK